MYILGVLNCFSKSILVVYTVVCTILNQQILIHRMGESDNIKKIS